MLEGNKAQNLTTVCFPGLNCELIPYDLDERDLKAGMVSACLLLCHHAFGMCMGFQWTAL